MSTTGQPPLQKPKRMTPTPGIPEGTLCASQSASILDGEVSLPVKLETTQAPLEFCFVFDEDEPMAQLDQYEFSSKFCQNFEQQQGSNFKEDHLRDLLYREFRHHGIECQNDNSDKFIESDLSNLFFKAEKFYNLSSQNNAKLNRKEQALLVTTTSRPDLATFMPASTAAPSNLQLGECKHSERYDREFTEHQCSLYLYAELYWLTVKLGLAVHSVYGFGFCGTKCKDNERDTYSIGFFEVSKPEHLGGRIVLRKVWKKFDLRDYKGVRLLLHFLKQGKASTFLDVNRVENPCPSYFTVPPRFWAPKPHRYELVRTGTRSIVFRVSLEGLDDIMTSFEASLPEDWRAIWKDHLETLRHVLGNIFAKLKRLLFGAPTFYIKIVTADTSYHLNKAVFRDFYNRVKLGSASIRNEVLGTYPVEPFVFETGLFVVLNDRGSAVQRDTFASFAEVVRAFKPIAWFSREMVDKFGVVHGDLLPFNIVVHDSQTLHVIDLDEMTLKGDILQREVASGMNDDIQWTLYPNLLVGKARLYNDVQLANTLDSFLTFKWDTMTSSEKMLHLSMHDALVVLGTWLKEGNDTAKVEDAANSVCNALETILQSVQ